jgi:hypothetical protein
VARRDVSNTPLQALTLLNDQVFLEAAQALAAEVASRNVSGEDRVRLIYRRLLSRDPMDGETKDLLQFFEAQKTRFTNGELDSAKTMGAKKPGTPEQAAWTVVVRALLNLDEAVTKG